MGLLIKNAVLATTNQKLDVLCEDGVITGLAPEISADGHTVLDAAGLMLSPGLVDLHVHLRDPGQTAKEDIATGTAAAAAGGFTAVACMPNTKPVGDSVEVMEYILDRAAKEGSARVLPIAAVTVGQNGETMTDFAALRQAGACAFSDDGVPVMSDQIAQDAMCEATRLGTMVISHCEDADMVKNYACNEGKISELLGIPGRPAIAEDKMVQRDCDIAAATGTRVHIAHVSTKGSVEIIRRAKAAGAPVTAETCPQYFIFTEDLVPEKGTMARINPPLRTEEDRQAILAGVLDGTLDVIVTDHAPHTAEEKAKPLTEAPSGMVGLETSFAACMTYLVKPGHLSLPQLIEKMSVLPSKLIGHDGGRVAIGAPADLMLFDPDEVWTVDPSQFRSRGRNTPFSGVELTGRVKATVCAGRMTYQAE